MKEQREYSRRMSFIFLSIMVVFLYLPTIVGLSGCKKVTTVRAKVHKYRDSIVVVNINSNYYDCPSKGSEISIEKSEDDDDWYYDAQIPKDTIITYAGGSMDYAKATVIDDE